MHWTPTPHSRQHIFAVILIPDVLLMLIWIGTKTTWRKSRHRCSSCCYPRFHWTTMNYSCKQRSPSTSLWKIKYRPQSGNGREVLLRVDHSLIARDSH